MVSSKPMEKVPASELKVGDVITFSDYFYTGIYTERCEKCRINSRSESATGKTLYFHGAYHDGRIAHRSCRATTLVLRERAEA